MSYAGDSAAESTTRTRGQEFHDLLLLGALACQAPAALLSVRQPDGSWSTLSYGFDLKEGLEDRSLFDAVCSAPGAVELPDVAVALPRSPLGRSPHSMRWAYGVAMRTVPGPGPSDAAVIVLDRWLRRATRREERALSALARRLGEQLSLWRNPSPAAVANSDCAPEGDAIAPGGSSAVAPRDVPRAAGPILSETAPTGATTEAHLLLRSQEVARLFDVTERTVINWAASGRLPSLRTIGGHLRFRRDDVLRLLANSGRP